MYHIVYLTTNLINSKFYVGVHSTYNLNDGYLGSGKALKSAIKKYSRQNFKRSILHYCLEAEHAYELESQIVNEYFVNLKNTYNVATGGNGGAIRPMTDERKHNISNSRKGQPAKNKGVPMTTEQKQKLSEFRKGTKLSDETKQKISDIQKGKLTWNKGIPMSEETKLKIKKYKICPYCNRTIDVRNYARYHGDKCVVLSDRTS